MYRRKLLILSRRRRNGLIIHLAWFNVCSGRKKSHNRNSLKLLTGTRRSLVSQAEAAFEASETET